jgi:hypothetical protein
MGALGRERVLTQFSWAHSVPTLLRAYAAAFERRERAAFPGRRAPAAPAGE